MAKLKIIPLGGLGEIGKNLTVYEYGQDICSDGRIPTAPFFSASFIDLYSSAACLPKYSNPF